MGVLGHSRLLHRTLRYLRANEVPLWRKLLGLAAVAYVVIPFDAIPDFIPVVGWLDDIGVVGAVVWFLVRDIRRFEVRSPEPRLPGGAAPP